MNVLIVDDHEETIIGIKSRLDSLFSISSSYQASNPRSAIYLIQTKPLDLILCDLEFKHSPEKDGFYVFDKVRDIEKKIKVIAYTSHGSYPIMKECIDKGFDSFLEKGCSMEEFEQTIHGVMDKGYFVSPSMKRLLKKRHEIFETKFNQSLLKIKELSKNELQTVILTAETLDTTVISKNISMNGRSVKPATVDVYIKRVVKKLDLRNRVELSFFAAESQNELLKYYSKK